jgi:hypothetical protein
MKLKTLRLSPSSTIMSSFAFVFLVSKEEVVEVKGRAGSWLQGLVSALS